ncbi:MAG: polynucleotide adenylyltransferase PcnB [Casimicrobiaceae bacterium]|nr:polynucleotide adenylyltransferase PcnB [Casimicrobiaceae bacterium]
MIRALLDRFLSTRSPRRREIPGASLGLSPAQISDNARRVCDRLFEAGFEAYIVGGAVRDALLGRQPKDFDVVTDAKPEQIKRLFRRAFIIGRRFRLVHVIMGEETIEVSTFRAHRAEDIEADETGRIVSDNAYGTQVEDAVRRDFTVNALYYDPMRNVVVDYVGALKDLRSRTLRVIGNPDQRYREDPVRMLRAVRLAVKLDLTIASSAARAIRRNAVLIRNVPSARLFDEVQKLLLSGYAQKTLATLREYGLTEGLLPLLDLIYKQPGGQRFIEVALANTDERVRQDKPVSPAFLFACLLWHEVLKRWETLSASGEHRIPALHRAIEEVLDEQRETITLPQRFAGMTKEIWLMQPRFEVRTNSSALRLVEQPRFRAAYDFLLLRAAAGECDQELADWWSTFIDSDPTVRAELIEQRRRAQALAGRAGHGGRRRRRRSGRGRGRSEAAVSTEAVGSVDS